MVAKGGVRSQITQIVEALVREPPGATGSRLNRSLRPGGCFAAEEAVSVRQPRAGVRSTEERPPIRSATGLV
jgi:hypothetical protein